MENANQLFSVEAEEALLGCMLLAPGLLSETDLLPEHFHIHRHRWMWQAMRTLDKRGTAVDFVTVQDELERAGKLQEIGGPAAIARLINSAPMASYAPEYAAIIREYARRRGWIELANKMAKMAYDKDADLILAAPEILDQLVTVVRPEHGAEHISRHMAGVLEELQARRADPSDLWGMETGFIDFDQITGGLQPGELLDLSGDPGVGKSILSMQMGFQLAERGNPGAIYSLEMPARQALRRRLSYTTRIPIRDIKQGRLDDNQFACFLQSLEVQEHLPLYLSDSVHWSTASLRADLARLKAQHNIKWFVLDYAYLLQDGKGLSESDRTGIISAQLKGICRSLDLAGIVIASMNKLGISNKLPGGEHLRGSGQQFYDADLLLFLVQGEQPNILTCIFGKGRELENPKQSFDLVRFAGFPALGNARIEHVQFGDNGHGWQERRDL